MTTQKGREGRRKRNKRIPDTADSSLADSGSAELNREWGGGEEAGRFQYNK